MKKEQFLSKKIGIILGSILFTLCFIGITYAAYLTGKTYNDVNMASMVTPDVTFSEDKTMMIQGILPTPKDIAIKAASTNGCYDKSDNPLPVCSLYEFTVTNTSIDELKYKVRFYLNIEQNTYTNYYYIIYEGEKENISEDLVPITDSVHLLNNDTGKKQLTYLTTELEHNQSKTYTILFYVNETGENQLYLDTDKVFTAKVEIETITTGTYKPNEPDIENTGLVPIKYNGTNWIVTTETDKEWYDYAEQKWANAASLKTGISTTPGTVLTVPDGNSITEENSDIYAMFVWIPRFSYTIGCTDINNDGNIDVDSTGTNSECLGYKIEGASDLAKATPGAIDIKFIGVDEKDELDIDGGTYPNYTYTSESDRNPTNWYTHPAFTFGSDELSGIWVGKFETTGSSTTPTILPNVSSLRGINISEQFATSQKFSASGNVYGITGDAHMAKNSEWAAVAYLSQSKYGKYGNSSYSGALKEIYRSAADGFATGRSEGTAPGTSSYSSSGTYKYDVEINGTGASTTGNIYGVYDIGGAWERVMGNYNNTVAGSGFSSSWFTTEGNAKYYDKFTTTTFCTTKSLETIGQASVETAGWYSDLCYFDESSVWVVRNGRYHQASLTGVFYVDDFIDGDSYQSFRTVFVVTGA